MDITRDFLDATNARRIVRDLFDAQLAASGRSEDDPALLVPLARLEDDWGIKPSAELRRFAAVFHLEDVPPALFGVRPLPEVGPDDNLVETLLELTSGEGPGQAAVFGIFHGALPIGRLVLPDQSLYLYYQLEDYAGIRKGRVVATPEVAGGAVVVVEKVLGTFLQRLAEDVLSGDTRYAAEEFEVWRTPSSWLVTSLLSGGAATLGLNRRWFYRLNPVFDDERWASLGAALGKDVPTSLYVLFRTFFLDERDRLAEALEVCAGAQPRLVRDAAALVKQLSDGRDAVGPIQGFAASRERISYAVGRGRPLAVDVEPAECLVLLETVAGSIDAEELFPPSPAPAEPEPPVAEVVAPPEPALPAPSDVPEPVVVPERAPTPPPAAPPAATVPDASALDAPEPPAVHHGHPEAVDEDEPATIRSAPETLSALDVPEPASLHPRSNPAPTQDVDPAAPATRADGAVDAPGEGAARAAEPPPPAASADDAPEDEDEAQRRVDEHASPETTGIWFDQAARGTADRLGYGAAGEGPLGVSVLTWVVIGAVAAALFALAMWMLGKAG